jgi:hypothetical protein
MTRIRRIISLLLVASVLPAAAHAQEADPTSRITLQAGGVVPLGKMADSYNLGFTVGAGFDLAPEFWPLGIRAEVGYTRFAADRIMVPDGQGGEESFTPKSSNLNVIVNAVFAPRMYAAQIRPYAIAGVGFYETSEGGKSTGGPIEFEGTDTKPSFGLNGGAGVRFRIAGFSSFVEARYHHLMQGVIDHNAISPRVEWIAANYLPITVGVTLGR